MTSHQFFMSYSSQDVEFVERLHNDLRERGFSIWRDKLEIRATDDWAKSIDKALRSTPYMIVVISQHSMTSDEVYREWSFFLSRGGKIVCVWLEDTDRIPFRLDPQQRIDFRSRADYESSLSNLSRELHLLLEQTSVTKKLELGGDSGDVITWEDIRRVASVFTRQMLEVRYAEKFDPSYYLQRSSIKAHFDDFLASDKVVMVLTGNAGTGKSSFICSLQEDKPQNLLILLQDCAHLELAAETSIEDYLSQILGIKIEKSYFSPHKFALE